MTEAGFWITCCQDCGLASIDPVPVCPACLGVGMERLEVSGRAVLETITIVRIPAPHFADKGPIMVGVARLREGGQLVTGRISAQTKKPTLSGQVHLSRDLEGKVLMEAVDG